MDEITLKKSVVISRQILLYFVDFYAAILPLFDKNGLYRIPLRKYEEFRIEDKDKFSHELYRLKQAGFIKEYFKEKEKFIELTPKGKKKLKKLVTDQLDFDKKSKWDKKWRLVIFDIPKTKNKRRDILRDKLDSIGFYQLQESVYVYPFECYKEIKLLKDMYYISPNVQYIVADRIETEINLIKKFTDLGVLKINKKK